MWLRLFPFLLWVWTEQSVTVGTSATEGRRSMPRTTRAAWKAPMCLGVEGSTAAPASNVSLLTRMERSLPSV